MKKLFWFLIALFLLSACDKEENVTKVPDITGFYRCSVIYNSGVSGSLETIDYVDTLEVRLIRDSVYSILEIGDVNIKNDLSFSGYHIDGKFSNDSIYLYYFVTPAAIMNYLYTGKKLSGNKK